MKHIGKKFKAHQKKELPDIFVVVDYEIDFPLALETEIDQDEELRTLRKRPSIFDSRSFLLETTEID